MRAPTFRAMPSVVVRTTCRVLATRAAAPTLCAMPSTTVTATSRSLATLAAPAGASIARRALRLAAVGGAAGLAGAAALYATDRPMAEAYLRVARCAVAAGRIVLDYKLTARESKGYGSEAAHAALVAAHARGGETLRKLCEQNGGLYIKIGQHIALLDYLVPEPYLRALRPLFDCAPRTPYPLVRLTIEEELGAPLETLFASFEREPIASASLAQVHRAIALSDGRMLAVKVQHPLLQQMARTEVALLALLVSAVRWLEPSFGFEWLVEEVRLNLPLELDFRNEASNAARCRALLLPRFGSSVHVPRVHAQLSTSRVLTMDFEVGAPASDAESVRALGLDPRTVARLLGNVWGEMAFGSGWVHCDPHPGNVLVRQLPGGRPQLVLLDHGLYRQIDDELRLQWARLWAAVVLSDEAEIRKVTKELGVYSQRMEALGHGLTYTLVAAMLTARPYKAVASGSLDALDVRALATDTAERAALAADVSQYASAIVEVLESMPRPLLLLLKVNDALRSSGLRLGARPSDTYIITALESLRALRGKGRGRSARARQWLRSPRGQLKLVRARARIYAYLLAEWLADAWHAAVGLIFRATV